MKIDRKFELIVLTVVGLGQLYITNNQLEVMKKQSEIAEAQNNITRAQQRPWVSSADFEIKDDIIHDSRGVSITINAKLKNSGQAVAQHASFAFTPYLYGYRADEKPVACQEAEQSHNHISIFPGDTVEVGTTALIPEAELTKVTSGFSNFKSTMDGIMTAIMVCISYRSPWGGEFHRTRYILMIGHEDPTKPRSLLPEFAKNTGVIPAASVSLRMLPIGQFSSAY